MGVTSKDESVEELIKKLNERGTKVKIVNDDEASNQTPKQRMSVKKEKLKSPNDSTKSHKESNKENKPEATKAEAAVVDETEKKRLEELKKQNEEISQIKDQQIQQNELLQNELMSKEQALEIEKKQKEELESLIAQMEKKLVHGGHGMDDLSE